MRLLLKCEVVKMCLLRSGEVDAVRQCYGKSFKSGNTLVYHLRIEYSSHITMHVVLRDFSIETNIVEHITM